MLQQRRFVSPPPPFYSTRWLFRGKFPRHYSQHIFVLGSFRRMGVCCIASSSLELTHLYPIFEIIGLSDEGYNPTKVLLL